MSKTTVPGELRERVAALDRFRCAFCRAPEFVSTSEHEIDHVVPEAGGGATEEGNLCLACTGCNKRKSARLCAIDPRTKQRVRLYHPRIQRWDDHFAWEAGGLRIVGRTAIGRATVAALGLNRSQQVTARLHCTSAGWHPPRE